jgi:hypothetical protein
MKILNKVVLVAIVMTTGLLAAEIDKKQFIDENGIFDADGYSKAIAVEAKKKVDEPEYENRSIASSSYYE